MRVLIIPALLIACVPGNRPATRVDAPSSPPTTLEVASFRAGNVPDLIDSLVAGILALDAEFAESRSGAAFLFTGENNSSFQRLTRIPEAIPRLVECLGWDRRSATTWHGTHVLVGAVCGHALAATPYVESRQQTTRLPIGLYDSGWGDYRNPPIEKLRAVQKAWRVQLIADPIRSQRSTQASSQTRIHLDGPPGLSRPLGARTAIQFDDEPPIINVSDGHGGPPITYHGQPLTNDQIKSIRSLTAKEAQDRFGDQTLRGAILIELK
jgi:hypothetical protein